MEHNSETIDSLNSLLLGEYMAVESFNNFIFKTDDDNVDKCFNEIQGQHRENISILADYIQDLGGKPKENLGMKGKMADMKISMDLGSNASPSEVIEKAIKGETQGVNMAEKVLRGNMDDKSRTITGQILENDRNSIKKLKKLM